MVHWRFAKKSGVALGGNFELARSNWPRRAHPWDPTRHQVDFQLKVHLMTNIIIPLSVSISRYQQHQLT